MWVKATSWWDLQVLSNSIAAVYIGVPYTVSYNVGEKYDHLATK